MPPVVLSIAGYDPSSGAGVTADIKTIAAHRCYGLTCITALTVQTTMGVAQVAPVAPEFVTATLKELVFDFEINAVRIGMLGSAEVAGAVAEFLSGTRLPNLVLDPVIRSSSGADLVDAAGLEVLRDRLLPLADVVTPNLAEAEALVGFPVRDRAAMRVAAGRLHQLGARDVVVTGGHLEGEAVDLWSSSHGLASPEGQGVQQEEFCGPRLESRSIHGTGCAFATALACNLALGRSMREAITAAKGYVSEAIAKAYPLGHGKGPLNHFP